jgi:hypothetical protein
MHSQLRLWRDEVVTKIVLRVLKERREQLNQELVYGDAYANKYRIQELDNLLDLELFEKLLEGEVLDHD